MPPLTFKFVPEPLIADACVVVTVSATGDGNDFAGFLLRADNSVGTFSVSSDDTQTACSVQYMLI